MAYHDDDREDNKELEGSVSEMAGDSDEEESGVEKFTEEAEEGYE